MLAVVLLLLSSAHALTINLDNYAVPPCSVVDSGRSTYPGGATDEFSCDALRDTNPDPDHIPCWDASVSPNCYKSATLSAEFSPVNVEDLVYNNGNLDWDHENERETYTAGVWYNPSEGAEWVSEEPGYYWQKNNWYKEEDGYNARMLHQLYKNSGGIRYEATVTIASAVHPNFVNGYPPNTDMDSAGVVFNAKSPISYFQCMLSVKPGRRQSLSYVVGSTTTLLASDNKVGVPGQEYSFVVTTTRNTIECSISGKFKLGENTPVQETLNLVYEIQPSNPLPWNYGTIGFATFFAQAVFKNVRFSREYLDTSVCSSVTGWNVIDASENSAEDGSGTVCLDDRAIRLCEDFGYRWSYETEECEPRNKCNVDCTKIRDCKGANDDTYVINGSGTCCKEGAGCTRDTDYDCCPDYDCRLAYTSFTGRGSRNLLAPAQRHKRYTYDECYWLAKGTEGAAGFVWRQIQKRDIGVCRPMRHFGPTNRRFHKYKTSLIFADAGIDYTNLGTAPGTPNECDFVPELEADVFCDCDCQEARFCEEFIGFINGRYCTMTNSNSNLCECQSQLHVFDISRDERCGCCFADIDVEEVDNNCYQCSLARGVWFDNSYARDTKSKTVEWLTRYRNHRASVESFVNTNWNHVISGVTVRNCIPATLADEMASEGACMGYRGDLFSDQNRWYPPRCVPYRIGWVGFGPGIEDCALEGGTWVPGQCYTIDGDLDPNWEVADEEGNPISCSTDGDPTCRWVPGHCGCDIDPVTGDGGEHPAFWDDLEEAQPMPELEDGECIGRTYNDWKVWQSDCEDWANPAHATGFGTGTAYNCGWRRGVCRSNYGSGEVCVSIEDL